MNRRGHSLRRTLTVVAISVTALALSLAVVLLVLTRSIQHSSSLMTSALESVVLAEEAEIELLLHASASEALVRRHLEEGLRRKLEAAQQHVSTPQEAQLHAEAVRRVEAYIDARPRDASTTAAHAAAYQAMEALVSVNLAQASDAKRSVERWNRIGDVAAIAIAGSLVLLVGGALLWIRRRAFQPVFALADVMHRFGRGEREVRAEGRGPTELAVMSERFNEMADALAAQRQAQIAFLGGVAHDLRGPLGALKLSLAAVGETDPGPAARRPLEIANRQISRMERMVADFLDSAKIDAGQLELRLQVLDARTIVTDVAEQLRGTSDKHELVVTTPAHRIPVRGDLVRLEQVLVNLLSNAIKYSPDGGTIQLSVERVHDVAIIRVADPGIGISAADQQRLFEPFRRVGFSQGTIPGVGLGLFVVRRIVEAHGGQLEVKSALGAGATFSVSLPLVATAAEIATEARLGELVRGT